VSEIFFSSLNAATRIDIDGYLLRGFLFGRLSSKRLENIKTLKKPGKIAIKNTKKPEMIMPRCFDKSPNQNRASHTEKIAQSSANEIDIRNFLFTET
jgi:hypothetical protein